MHFLLEFIQWGKVVYMSGKKTWPSALTHVIRRDSTVVALGENCITYKCGVDNQLEDAELNKLHSRVFMYIYLYLHALMTNIDTSHMSQ